MKPSILWAPLVGCAVLGLACASPLIQSGSQQSPAQSNTTFKVHKTDAEWKKILTPEAYDVLRNSGTETAYSSPLEHNHLAGIYYCAGCGKPLFSSTTKFESGTGWPSFYKPIKKGAVIEKVDHTLGMDRTEILCARCGGHLGHVFDDGPPPTGLRYCMNGVALDFKKGATELPEKAKPTKPSASSSKP